ncbi:MULTISPECIES: 5'/3'-nucleotidase SurE [Methanocorpusculum]|jgi:5'-nucleotidase|uniref:5'-nucleotidase SurE n=1 Tax=Methanocorpusculum parvum TaxID=2193 RepID=A0AAX0QAZ0_9EURY|nr:MULTISPECIES: 5'/3'-nucleotidase SurE [Methanocorpusculum]MDD2248260.1 5'/3'-nucleotidase SurE [Methanocorpusculum sp.]MDD3046710.1 5'/3'-nucleotidase SurE [Methanocorpusculum sp.]MDD3912010.1 5'/3'-nucleotidase SurE [Methanocorpusculum sp.]MDD4423046.1 5'/3'-nucleotidase SurE [Methanocorpusculum parvum]MDY3202846.1 5'/3'-nucleotidase SurE [Methanocorpusculum sp.]
MSRPKILLTNDDGINSGGLWAAYDALSLIADVTVVAPATQQSAVGRSISIFEPIRMNEVAMHQTRAYSVEGRPTDALLLGLYGLGLRPDLVVSGINLGENISFESITTSGTVGAAMEAVNQGVPAIAYSLQMNDQGNKFADPRTHKMDFTQSKEVVTKFTRHFLKNGMPAESKLININIPAKRIEGYAVTVLGERLFETSVEQRIDPRGKPYYWINGTPIYIPEEHSDVTAIRKNYVSITPLSMDNTAYKACSELKKMIADIN